MEDNFQRLDKFWHLHSNMGERNLATNARAAISALKQQIKGKNEPLP